MTKLTLFSDAMTFTLPGTKLSMISSKLERIDDHVEHVQYYRHSFHDLTSTSVKDDPQQHDLELSENLSGAVL